MVWPAHTSTTGYHKYLERYGVSVHYAVTLVIGRRAMGLKEQISKELKHKISAKIAKFKEELDQ